MRSRLYTLGPVYEEVPERPTKLKSPQLTGVKDVEMQENVAYRVIR